MKILALNLPQFHEVKENNEWWGKGFTEWTNVKKASPLYNGHVQPQEPLDDDYYDLSKVECISKQCILAKKFGVDGFVYFHYWYEGRKLLEKPCEILLDNKEIDIEYCFCWANHPWTRAWDGKKHQILLDQTYGDKRDWDMHIDYLMNFFKDDRYLKNENKPLFVIYNPSDIPNFDDMISYWNDRLKENGFDGLYLIEYISSKNPKEYSRFSKAVYEDQPMFAGRFLISNTAKAKRYFVKNMKWLDFMDYDKIWTKILSNNRTYGNKEIIQGVFPSWDNSPRRGKKGSTIVKGSSPEKFKSYLKRTLLNKRSNVSTDYIIINAWNEWGEGAMLEPTKENGYKYLEAINDIRKELKI